jgi:hypothetical protein
MSTKPPLLHRRRLSRRTLGAIVALCTLLGLVGIGLFISRAAQNPAADLNADNQVNVFDLSILLSKWGTADATSDINDDGSVGILDLSILLSSWGAVTTGIHDLNFDFDTGNYSQFLSNAYGGFEVGDPNTSHQTQLVTTTRNGSGYATRFEVHNDPIDKASGTFRALWSKYDTNDGLPSHPDVYWGMSLMLPNEGGQTSLPVYEHLWELHQRQNIYQVPACAIAPHALMVRNNRLEYRMMTGACKWTGSAWNGYTAYHDQVPVLPSISLGTWYDVIVHIKFSENNDGLLEVWARAAGQPWPAAPQVSIAASTLPYIPGGLDPAFPTKASTSTPDSNGNTGLYLQTGLYTGGNTWNLSGPAQHIHISDNLRRYGSLTSAKAGFPQ